LTVRLLRFVTLIALAAALAASGCGTSAPAASRSAPGVAASPVGADPPPGSSAQAIVVRVVDGDTIRAKIGRRVERVRFIGMDTPEVVKPNTPVQCFGREASARTKALLPEGSVIHLVADVEARDRYRRLLAYVYRDLDGAFVNLLLVEEGYAVPYTYPPNVAHADDFVAAAGRARDERRGLWSRCR
jgi:micrococcal nuclease